MSDDKFSSSSKYSVSNISSIDINTKIVKRPYTSTPFNPNKKHSKSNSFKDTLKSVVSHKSTDDSEDFSNLLSSDLNDTARLRNAENSRFIKSTFQNTSSTDNTIDSIQTVSKGELQESSTVDTSLLYKKLELLNSIKK